MRFVAALLLLGVLVAVLAPAACGRSARPARPVAPDAPPPAPDSAPPAPDGNVAPAEFPAPPADTSAWTRLGPAEAGSWRQRFPDDLPLSFEDYVESEPVRAEGEERVVAFQPVGDFGVEERRALDAAAAFVGIWFDLPVRVLPPTPLTEEPEHSRPLRGYGDERVRQFRTGWFLNTLLPDLRPRDAVVLLGVTMADLYPKASWNYVFGEAHLRRRVGVYSLARYFPEFSGEERTPASLSRALLRTLKVVTHETGHTFGLEHCVTWKCCMNGSNSLAETDAQPLLLCPECERKLVWNRSLDPAERAERIADFLAKHGLAEEAAWHRARAAAATGTSAPRQTPGRK